MKTFNSSTTINLADDYETRFETEADAIEFAKTMKGDWKPLKTDYACNPWTVGRDVQVGDFLNMSGYSDVRPFQVVRMTASGTTAYVRAVDALIDPSWKPDTAKGGFAGHTRNNRSQRWIFGELKGNEVAVRLNKAGYKSTLGKHFASEKPARFHDYNF